MASNLHFDLSHFSLLKISGEDAAEFLENQLTTHLPDLEQHGWLMSAWCNPKGRVLADFILYKREDAFYLVLPSMLKQNLVQRLRMFILRARVQIEDADENHALIGLQGSQIEPLLEQLDQTFVQSQPKLSHIEQISCIRFPDNTPRVMLVIAADSIRRTLNQILMACQESDRSYWSLLDIKAGIPWVTTSTTEKFLPQMLNLDLSGGLSFQKGCYPGQEVIARVHYRGEVKQRLCIGTGHGNVIPGPGDVIEDAKTGKSLGDVIDAEPSGDASFQLIAACSESQDTEHQAVIRGQANTALTLEFLSHN